ncbi:hypothetical protein [Wolbachia endosymbiont (group A) of Anomoia purmunda]|uniref:hypothetical protein n=1 Tax=Wolbachia endosymbiont (group A) of Anomoia purmunda TaxID=2953978 RepID=UPI00222EE862|nr:hypothetical protein [Wolbachia endosymbiont (group A) of Anomoia purmunda]
MAADEVVSCTIDTICMCGGKVVLEDEIIHQKAELPEIKPIVTEYRLQRGRVEYVKKELQQIYLKVLQEIYWEQMPKQS